MKKNVFLISVLVLVSTGLYAASVAKDYYDAQDISNISVSLSYEDIEIRPSKDLDSEISVEIGFNNRYKVPQISVENGSLVISSDKKGSWVEDCTVYICVPEEMDLNELKINTTSGDISIEDLTVSEITVESTSGDIDLKNVTAAKLNGSATKGDIQVKNVDIGSFDLMTSSGIIYVKLTNIPVETSSLKSNKGDIDLRVEKDSAFQVNVISKHGWFEDDFNGKNLMPKSLYKSKYNGGGTIIEVETGWGTFNLDD